jgi:hypothetical protein
MERPMAQGDDIPEFKFIPEYADAIASIASCWATLEYYVNNSIWIVAGLNSPTGACITSQIFTLQGRLAALLSLLKLYRAPDSIISRVNKFSDNIRGPQESRNRVVHDIWLMDNRSPGSMGRLETTAPKKLQFSVKDIPLTKLREIYAQLSASRMEFYDIRRDISDGRPSFPGIPASELDPIPGVR